MTIANWTKLAAGALAAALIGGAGCASSGGWFAPDVSRRPHTVAKRRAAVKKQRKERERPPGDPVADTINGLMKSDDKRGYLEDSNLSSDERRVLNGTMNNPDDRKLVDSVHKSQDDSRRSREEWVFGKNPVKSSSN